MVEMGETVFRGSIEDCLEQLGRLFRKQAKSPEDFEQLKKPILDFCQISPRSITRWLYTDTVPEGERRVRLTCYLALIGYQVIEHDRLPMKCKFFAELIGFGILTASTGAEVLGYKSSDQLLRVLLGRENASKEKEELMWTTWLEHRDAFIHRKSEMRARFVPQSPKGGRDG